MNEDCVLAFRLNDSVGLTKCSVASQIIINLFHVTSNTVHKAIRIRKIYQRQCTVYNVTLHVISLGWDKIA